MAIFFQRPQNHDGLLGIIAQMEAHRNDSLAQGIQRGVEGLMSGVSAGMAGRAALKAGGNKILEKLVESGGELTEAPKTGTVARGTDSFTGEPTTKKVFDDRYVPQGSRLLSEILPGMGMPEGVAYKPKAKTDSMVQVDDIIRQSAERLGYNLKSETTQIPSQIAETLVRGGTSLKVNDAKAGAWAQRITGAQKSPEMLLDYRRQIVQDYTMGPDEQQNLLKQIDSMLKGKLNIQGQPRPTTQSVLPGLSTF